MAEHQFTILPIPTHPLFRDLTGKRFTRLRVIGYLGQVSGFSSWLCRCKCGNLKQVRGPNLIQKQVRSCGCLSREVSGARWRKHGMRHRSEYNIWNGMRHRCFNANMDSYPDYGGRGIRPCERWSSFVNFFADMGPRPSRRHTLDRIDNNAGYWCGKPECPDCGPLSREPNCRWATQIQQSRNTRHNHLLTLNGETRCAAEWATITGIPAPIITRRHRAGWTDERALTTPARRRKPLSLAPANHATHLQRSGDASHLCRHAI